MVNLTTEDRQQLITLLKDLPELASEGTRREILELAGLRQMIPMIDLSGASLIAVSRIVSYLSNFGRLTYDNEALGLFLNFIKSLIGVQQQEFLDTLLTKYNMMTPIAPSPELDNWRGIESEESVLEKIIGENTLRPIAFLAQGLQVAQSVAYIGVHAGTKGWSGTGFLVAPNLILTNHHVVSDVDLLPNTLFRFNYEENFMGEAQKPIEYRAKPNGLFHVNKALDYAIIQLDEDVGSAWGWLPLLPRTVKRTDRVNIIQHPNGRPKQISLQNNFVEYVGDNVVQYVTSTLPGSSGSPVLNDGWEVVALHHSGGNISEPTTKRRYFRNEGILIEKILTDLPPELGKIVSTASAG